MSFLNAAAASASRLLKVPPAPTRKRTQHTHDAQLQEQKDEMDNFLSSDLDLEISFASTMSISSPHRDASLPPSDVTDAMDISPMPPMRTRVAANPTNENADLSSGSASFNKPASRARASTVSRTFGIDVSNDSLTLGPVSPAASKFSDKTSGSTAARRTQRSTLPFEWMSTSKPAPAEFEDVNSTPPAVFSPGDAMDVDDYIPTPVALPSNPSAPALGNLFYDDMSPRRSREHTPTDRVHRKKRRSLSPEGSPAVVRVAHHHGGTMRAPAYLASEDDALESSPGLVSSPSVSCLMRKASGPLLSPSPFAHDVTDSPSESISAVLMQKRTRRPALSSMQKTSLGLGRPGAGGSLSANDAIDRKNNNNNDNSEDVSLELRPSASRRAFSAMLPPSHKGLTGFAAAQAAVAAADVSEDDTSFDGPDMSSPAQAYTKRQSMKTLRRCDGTDNFRPLTGMTAHRDREPAHMQQMKLQVSPSGRLLPGFGDNEALGKILPCYRVREDGLMRIKPKTLNALLDGDYDSQITDFIVIDCRFDYEYKGGHIPGAVNLNSPAAVEELFLKQLIKPAPSSSADGGKKKVIVFHCEFSAKRAPTFAKHLRSKDRSMNNHVYPKVHYPEVYILEGGYCRYFKECADRCEPRAYVTMDDPAYATERKEDLDQFRKARFGRTKSYAYGDASGKMFGGAGAGASSGAAAAAAAAAAPSQAHASKRNTAPVGGGAAPMFAAANVAKSRRIGHTNSLSTLPEDAHAPAPSDDEGGETDIGDSPCPPPNKGGATLGQLKGKKVLPRTLIRSETYGPSRMAY